MSFDEKIVDLIKRVPSGKVTTYRILAQKLNSKAYRAVGNACHRNPNAPSVPCHRVVRSDEKIGGYSKGVKKKIKLLRKEGIEIEKNRIKNFNKVLFSF